MAEVEGDAAMGAKLREDPKNRLKRPERGPMLCSIDCGVEDPFPDGVVSGGLAGGTGGAVGPYAVLVPSADDLFLAPFADLVLPRRPRGIPCSDVVPGFFWVSGSE